jgi:hypothetical protein
MRADIRRKMAMADRALDFAAAHPSTDASYNALVARLKDRLARADQLAIQQREGQTLKHAAVTRRDALRESIERVQLRHLVGVAYLASKEHPELAELFPPVPTSGPHKNLITAAKGMLAAAQPQKELFVSLGLGDTFLDDLTQAIADFDKATEEAHTGTRDHVGAGADLLVAADDCVKLTLLLDGLYKLRFRNDPESLAAWKSARNVVGPFLRKLPAPAPVAPPVPAPADVTPVAAPIVAAPSDAAVVAKAA